VSANGIFLDDYSAHILVENNVCPVGMTAVAEQSMVGPDRNAHDNIVRNNGATITEYAEITAAAGPKMVTGVTTTPYY
jgi:hypothetical protein